MTELLEKPVRPEDDDCCGGNCCPCVWDTFYKARKEWKDQQALMTIQTPENL